MRKYSWLLTVPYCSRRKIVGIEQLPLQAVILVWKIPILAWG